mmetsp:Transcript_50966/g.83503  ORF Transcript_50966/g.83503 Transcript_50966/m.83503 type:complete len:537 (+) Transcript_50966:591-2201(+)
MCIMCTQCTAAVKPPAADQLRIVHINAMEKTLAGLQDGNALLDRALFSKGLAKGLVFLVVHPQQLPCLQRSPSCLVLLLLRIDALFGHEEQPLQRLQVLPAPEGRVEVEGLAHRARQGHHAHLVHLPLGEALAGLQLPVLRRVELHERRLVLHAVVRDGQAQQPPHQEVRRLVPHASVHTGGVDVAALALLPVLDAGDQAHDEAGGHGADAQKQNRDGPQDVGDGGPHVFAREELGPELPEGDGRDGEHHEDAGGVVLDGVEVGLVLHDPQGHGVQADALQLPHGHGGVVQPSGLSVPFGNGAFFQHRDLLRGVSHDKIRHVLKNIVICNSHGPCGCCGCGCRFGLVPEQTVEGVHCRLLAGRCEHGQGSRLRGMSAREQPHAAPRHQLGRPQPCTEGNEHEPEAVRRCTTALWTRHSWGCRRLSHSSGRCMGKPMRHGPVGLARPHRGHGAMDRGSLHIGRGKWGPCNTSGGPEGLDGGRGAVAAVLLHGKSCGEADSGCEDREVPGLRPPRPCGGDHRAGDSQASVLLSSGHGN